MQLVCELLVIYMRHGLGDCCIKSIYRYSHPDPVIQVTFHNLLYVLNVLQMGYWNSCPINMKLHINDTDIKRSEWMIYLLGTDIIKVVTFIVSA